MKHRLVRTAPARRDRVLMCLLPALAVSCTSTTSVDVPARDVKPVVVTTNAVVRAIVELVVGDSATVLTVVPDGKDPHDYEPSAADIAPLARASMVVQVGLGYEHSVEDLVRARVGTGVPVFDLVDHVTVVDGDPHVFTDPLTVDQAVPDLAAALAGVTGIDATESADRARAVLRRTADEARTRLAPVVVRGGCLLVTEHESLGYFARRFGCDIVGVVTPSFSSSAETSAAQVQKLVDTVETIRRGGEQVRALFVEKGSSRAVAEKIREVSGLDVVELGVHSLPSDGTYESYVVELAHTVLKGLTS